MGDTAGEQPQTAFADIVDKSAAIRIDPGYARGSRSHIGPFRSYMPVQLPNTSLDQAHLDPGHLLGDRTLATSHLVCPPPAFHRLGREPDVAPAPRWRAASRSTEERTHA